MRSRRTTGALTLVACLLGLLLAGPAQAERAAGPHALGQHHLRAQLVAAVSVDPHRHVAAPDVLAAHSVLAPSLVAWGAVTDVAHPTASRPAVTVSARGPPDDVI